MKLLCKALFLALFPSLLSAVSVRAALPDRPNIVLIFVDDLGWADLECYGNTFHETPHIDQLAAHGLRFTDAYAAGAVCSPTRASLLSGKYPAHVRITDFIPGHWRPWERLIVAPIENQLPLEELTFAEVLRELGYATGYFGKWHLGGREYYPDRQGFQTSIVTAGHFGPRLSGDRSEKLDKDVYLTDWLTEQGMEFIEKHRDQPFLLQLSHYTVHIPLQAKAKTIEYYEQKAQGRDATSHPTYAAMLHDLDQAVGRLMRRLDELDLADDTLVVFYSDNGGLIQRYDGQGPIVSSLKPLRGEKGTLYEGGIRVPLIIRWPGVVEPGRESNVPVTTPDLYVTMVEAGGFGVDPSETDGASLVPILQGGDSLARESIYWHYPHYHHMDPAGAIRQGDWKLIEHFDDGQIELYNLGRDIGEENDLAEAEMDRAQAMQQDLAKWRESVGARMPTRNPDFDPAKADQWKRRPR